MWWADDLLAQIGTVRKKDGQNLAVLRTKTTGVVQIRVYDKDGQKGKVTTPPVGRIIGSHKVKLPAAHLITRLMAASSCDLMERDPRHSRYSELRGKAAFFVPF